MDFSTVRADEEEGQEKTLNDTSATIQKLDWRPGGEIYCMPSEVAWICPTQLRPRLAIQQPSAALGTPLGSPVRCEEGACRDELVHW